MSDTEVLKKISFSQGGRTYTWMTSVFPVARRVIETHSANMHMIPADGDIERRLKSIRAGNIVHLKGFLGGGQRAGRLALEKLAYPRGHRRWRLRVDLGRIT